MPACRRPLRLCGFASHSFFFAQSLPVGRQGAKPELGQLPPDMHRDRLLKWGLGGFLDFSRKGAETQRNLTANGSNLLVLVSYFFVLGTLCFILTTCYLLLFLMSNAARPVQNGEVGNSANGTISYFLSRISYLVHCTLYFVQK